MMQYFKIFYDGEHDIDLFIVVPLEAFTFTLQLLISRFYEIKGIEVFYQ